MGGMITKEEAPIGVAGYKQAPWKETLYIVFW
jgi:hypothetical protein